jgi:5-methyltetrahydrofolate--homocysteine methyltransferase
MDGAMGTELQRAGIGENECYEAWNLTHPDKVRAIHQAYVDAGAEVLLTNTFQANVPALSKHGLVDKLELIIDAGVGLARSVAGRNRFVMATFGPTVEKGDMVSSDLEQMARRLRAARDADLWLFETMSDTADLYLALQCAKHFLVTNFLPVLSSWTYLKTSEGKTQTVKGIDPIGRTSRSIEELKPSSLSRNRPVLLPKGAAIDASKRLNRTAWLERLTIHAHGVNCGRDIGMDEIIEIIRRYRQETDLPLFARPNAGTPTRVGDRWVYPLTPEKMAERLPELLEAGVNMVGGCCGTTPEHIAAMRPIIDAWNTKRGLPPTRA